MRTLKQIPVKYKRIDIIPEALDYGVIYISNRFNVSAHLCLCGCRNLAVTPFSKNGKGWRIIEDKKGITITPSILNTNCPNRYHYIITDGIANVV